MATLTVDSKVYMEQWLDTPFDAICVKRHDCRNRRFDEAAYGRISVPPLLQGEIKSEVEMQKAVEGVPEVVVVSHGFPGETLFVWRGTPDEFRSEWQGD